MSKAMFWGYQGWFQDWDKSIIMDVKGITRLLLEDGYYGFVSMALVFWWLFKVVLMDLLSWLLWVCFGGCRLMS
jgi:hypothetical protein